MEFAFAVFARSSSHEMVVQLIGLNLDRLSDPPLWPKRLICFSNSLKRIHCSRTIRICIQYALVPAEFHSRPGTENVV